MRPRKRLRVSSEKEKKRKSTQPWSAPVCCYRLDLLQEAEQNLFRRVRRFTRKIHLTLQALGLQEPSEKVFGVGARRVPSYLLRMYLEP